MASKPGTPATAIRATATLVGNTFVNKYYNVLHQSPQVVHRFYTDESVLSRAEAGPNGVIDIVSTQAGIDQKIMSLDYRDFRAEIKTVDSLESLNGSVLVMVTGSLSMQGRPKRNFAQTFFLAPQNVGYFVLNDMFRYLDGEPEPMHESIHPLPSDQLSNGTIEHQTPAPPEAGMHQTSPSLHNEHSNLATEALEPSSVEEVHHVPVDEVPPVADQEINEDVGEVTQQEVEIALTSEDPPPIEEASSDEAPKKSYASILRVKNSASSGSSKASTAAKNTPAQNDYRVVPSQSTQSIPAPETSTVSEVPALTPEDTHEDSADDSKGDGRSVYVKNLPLNITTPELETEFKKFGSIKAGGVNLRNHRIGVCFAFIEFDEIGSAQKAIEASPILISGRQVYVEEKKTMPAPPRATRGRFGQGRGYQNDGTRGRGYFGGRGFSRGGGQDFDREGGRGRGNFNTVNGYRRADNQGSNVPRSVRRGSGHQAMRGRGGVTAEQGV